MLFRSCDIILGIDWLTKYHANLDCVGKLITFLMPRSVPFHSSYNPSSDAFLTSCVLAIESTSTKLTVAQISIICDCEDVFQNISGLSPKIEIDFCIELALGTLLISKLLTKWLQYKC